MPEIDENRGLDLIRTNISMAVLAGARGCDCTTRGARTRSSSFSVAAADGFASRSTGPTCASAPSCKTCASTISGLTPRDNGWRQSGIITGFCVLRQRML